MEPPWGKTETRKQTHAALTWYTEIRARLRNTVRWRLKLQPNGVVAGPVSVAAAVTSRIIPAGPKAAAMLREVTPTLFGTGFVVHRF